MKRRWGIFRKMLMSYLVITLIPFVLLSVSVIEMTNQSYAKSLLQRSEMELDRAQTVLDVRLTEILTMAYQLSENTVLFTDDLTQYTRYESVEKIRQMRVGNQFVKNIALWHTAKQEVYTSSGVMSKATYVKEVLKLQEENCDLQEHIRNGFDFGLYPARLSACAVGDGRVPHHLWKHPAPKCQPGPSGMDIDRAYLSLEKYGTSYYFAACGSAGYPRKPL